MVTHGYPYSLLNGAQYLEVAKPLHNFNGSLLTDAQQISCRACSGEVRIKTHVEKDRTQGTSW